MGCNFILEDNVRNREDKQRVLLLNYGDVYDSLRGFTSYTSKIYGLLPFPVDIYIPNMQILISLVLMKRNAIINAQLCQTSVPNNPRRT